MQPGTRLEHYTIIDKIGEGGMGAVYRAEDTRLKRQVAVKVLPPSLAFDAERLARLEREAQLLASLSHPNVAVVYGFGGADVDDGGRRHVAYLVMELVEGQSLHSRIASGPLPWREAIEIAVGIAAGLEAAHERGIVHRDLKPANVHLTHDGSVKVLDFGLAKALDPGGASGSLDLSASPTVPATRTGMILGTAAYMSPEQARGRSVDKRADIWALGCVIYEMLTGRKTFEGETVSDLLAAVLKEPPNLEALPPVPARLRALLARMLEKDPKLRARDVGDVRLELQAALNERPQAAAVADGRGLSWRIALPAAILLIASGLAAGWLFRGAPPSPPEARVILATTSTALGTDAIAIAPGGSVVAETTPAEGIRVRALDDLSWRLLPDTRGANALTFDASGTRLYFGRGVEVLSVGVDGGSPIVEATFEASTQVYGLFRGLAGDVQASIWLNDSRIVRLSAGGGAVDLWRGKIADTNRLIATTELASGRWVAWLGTQTGSDGLVVVGAGIETPTAILSGYRSPTHVGGGEVLTVDDRGRLATARFDEQSGAVIAPPVVRVEGLALLGGNIPAYDIDGRALVYVSGAIAEAGETLAWLDRDGTQTAATARKGRHDTDSRLAPDGLSLALEVAATETSPLSVWIHDLERDVRSALTPGIRATFPVWSRDSRRVALRLGDGIEPQGIYVVPADRSAAPRLLLAEAEGKRLLPMDWSPDGQWLLYVQSATLQRVRAGTNDLWRLPISGGAPEPVLATAASEVDARYSPDGRWIAYMSDQTGQYEVYLRPAAGGGETRVSADGGIDPEWNPSGGELFFTRGRDVYAVAVRENAARPVGAEQKLLTVPATANNRFLLPSADGRRFVISQFADSQRTNAIHAVLNWRRTISRPPD